MANWMLGLGQGLSNVNKTLTDFYTKRDADQQRTAEVLGKLYGTDALNTPQYVQALKTLGIDLPHAAPGTAPGPGVGSSTGVVIPQDTQDQIMTRDIKRQQQTLTFDLIKRFVNKGAPGLGQAPQLQQASSLPTPSAPGPQGPPSQTPAVSKSGGDTGGFGSPGFGASLGMTDRQGNRVMQGMVLKSMFPNLDDAILNEPMVQIHHADDSGNEVVEVKPQSEAPGVYKAPPTSSQKDQQVNTDVGLNMLTQIAKQYGVDLATGSVLTPQGQPAAPGAKPTGAAWVGPYVSKGMSMRRALPEFAREGMVGDFIRQHVGEPKIDPGQASYYANIATMKNATIKAITGAQMSEPEAKRIAYQIPSESDQPEEHMAKMLATYANQQYLQKRLALATQMTGGRLPAAGSPEAAALTQQLDQTMPPQDPNPGLTRGMTGGPQAQSAPPPPGAIGPIATTPALVLYAARYFRGDVAAAQKAIEQQGFTLGR